MATRQASIDGGFADPVLDAQRVFRPLMDSMARPGSRRTVARAAPPHPLSPVAGALALALLDHDTPVWLDPLLAASDDVVAWLGFHTGAPVTPSAVDAHFAIVARPAELMALENFAQGSQEYPDRSATIILQVDTFDAGVPLVLTGPGIRGEIGLSPAPMPRHFIQQWRQNNARFPRGIDLVMAAPEGVACLPRTTRIREAVGA